MSTLSRERLAEVFVEMADTLVSWSTKPPPFRPHGTPAFSQARRHSDRSSPSRFPWMWKSGHPSRRASHSRCTRACRRVPSRSGTV